MSERHSTNGKSIRFASLERVSTERQEEQGESLRTQRADNARDVATLGGRIVARYGGQEHGTPGFEHAEVDRLIADAAKGRFDAVIVNKSDRWSRDNSKSEEGLETFARAGVRFFVRTREYNLHDEDDRFSIGIDVLIGQRTARSYARRALRSRIARAARGLPASSGRLPYGRLFVWNDRRHTDGHWEVDPKAKAIMENVAQRYVRGESLKSLAREHGLKYWNVRHTLAERCGAVWVQQFNSDRLSIHESVPTTVPRLLDDATLRAVRARLAAGNTYLRKGGRHVNDYLLSGYIFCGACGCNLCGRIDRHGQTYYEHSYAERQVRCPLNPRPRVPAGRLEHDVILQLQEMFSTPALLERAVAAASPDVAKERQWAARLRADLDHVAKQRGRLLDAYTDGLFTKDQVRAKKAALDADEASLSEQLAEVETALEDVPDEGQVKAIIKRYGNGLHFFDGKTGAEIDGAEYLRHCEEKAKAERRWLVEAVFGRPVGGKPGGVYVLREGEQRRYHRKSKVWSFTLRGLLPFEKVVMTGGPSRPPTTALPSRKWRTAPTGAGWRRPAAAGPCASGRQRLGGWCASSCRRVRRPSGCAPGLVP
jgi:site-specific DNA recombinase